MHLSAFSSCLAQSLVLSLIRNDTLFSEGPQKAKESNQTSSLGSRIFWVLVCTLLWPIMVITGMNTAWILYKRRQKSQK